MFVLNDSLFKMDSNKRGLDRLNWKVTVKVNGTGLRDVATTDEELKISKNLKDTETDATKPIVTEGKTGIPIVNVARPNAAAPPEQKEVQNNKVQSVGYSGIHVIGICLIFNLSAIQTLIQTTIQLAEKESLLFKWWSELWIQYWTFSGAW